ncbi:hypothetical protein EBU95_21985 [bacterium]|nr:hypothetical protein [bacterium]
MYKCIIPGEQIFPFCYIERMDVEFMGSRRMLPIQSNLPTGGTTNAIIPDAYNVTLSIKSLNPSSGNFMLANQKVQVRS